MGKEIIEKYKVQPPRTELEKRWRKIEQDLNKDKIMTGDVHSETEHVRRGKALEKYLSTASLEDIQALSTHPKVDMLVSRTGGYPDAIATMNGDQLGVLALNRKIHPGLNSVIGSLALSGDLLQESPFNKVERQQAITSLHEKLSAISLSASTDIEKSLRSVASQLPSTQKAEVTNLIAEGVKVKVGPGTSTSVPKTSTPKTTTNPTWQQKQEAEKLKAQQLEKEQLEQLKAKAQLNSPEGVKPPPVSKTVTVESFLGELGNSVNNDSLRQDLSTLLKTDGNAEKLLKGMDETKLDSLLRLESQVVNQSSEITARQQRLAKLLPKLSDDQLTQAMKGGQFNKIMGDSVNGYSDVCAKSLSPSQIGIIASQSTTGDNVSALAKMVAKLDKDDKDFGPKLEQIAKQGAFKGPPKTKEMAEAKVAFRQEFEKKVGVLAVSKEVRAELTGVFKPQTNSQAISKPPITTGDTTTQKVGTGAPKTGTSIGQSTGLKKVEVGVKQPAQKTGLKVGGY